MPTNTHKIIAVCDGKQNTFRYRADSQGRHHPSYVTSYRQLCSLVARQFSLFDFRLHYLSGGRSYSLSSDADLKKALSGLRDSGVLAVNVTPIDAVVRPADFGGKHIDWNQGAFDKYHDNLSLSELLHRFVIHRVPCYCCRTPHISGIRYEQGTSGRYNACASCYKKMASHQKRFWRTCALPWKYDAPEAPLQCGDKGSDVLQLQYLLTRLGFMKHNDTNQRAGCFYRRTEHAIEKFRRHYRLSGRAYIYDRAMARKLAEVVRKRRAEGHPLL